MITGSKHTPYTPLRRNDPRWWSVRRRLIRAITIVFLLATLSGARAVAQSGWQDEQRLTYDDAVSYGPPNNAKYIAVDDMGRVHVVWSDERDKNREIYHMVQSNCVWSAPERLTWSVERSARPVLAVDGTGRVHLVWNDSKDGNKEIYHKIWTGSWDADRRVSETDGDSFASSVVADGFTLHLVYNEMVDGHNEVMYRVFDFIDWSAAVQLTSEPSGDRMVASIALGPDGSLHVAWWDTREDPPGNTEGKIYYRSRTTCWLPEECVSGPDADAMRSNITVDDSGHVHVVWIDKRGQYEQIYYRKRTAEGWAPESPLTSSDYTHYHPSIASAGDDIYLTYWATYPSPSNPGVYFRSMVEGAWGYENRITPNHSMASLCCLIAEPNKNLHVAWVDQRDGNMEIYYRLYIHPQNGVGDRDDDEPPEIPRFPLALDAAPNPFSIATRIDLTLPEEAEASIRIYDVSGRLVTELAEGRMTRGSHPFLWTGMDRDGTCVAPGLYLVRARAGKRMVTRKLLLVR